MCIRDSSVASAAAAERDRTRTADAGAPNTLQLVAPEIKTFREQTVYEYDFTIADAGTAEFTEPAEPARAQENKHVALKNETYLLNQLKTERFDHTQGSRDYFYQRFYGFVSTVYKHNLDYPSYDDLMRDTDMLYYGTMVWWSRVAHKDDHKQYMSDAANSDKVLRWDIYYLSLIHI